MYTGNFKNNKNLTEFLQDAKQRFTKHHGEEYPVYLEKLQELAQECTSYRELGVMQGVSMAAVILGKPDISYCHGVDLDFSKLNPHRHLFEEFEGNLNWTISDSINRNIDWDPVDMLFIDSSHKAPHLWAELKLHHKFVNKYIVCHDTQALNMLRHIVDKFIKYHKKEWKLIKHYKPGVGFSVISRKN